MLLLGLGLMGCQPAADAPLPTAAATAVSTTAVPATAAPATAVATLPPTQPPPPTPVLPTSTPPPTPTTAPPLTLALPPEWQESFSAISSANLPPLQLRPDADPAALFAAGEVDAALSWNGDGVIVWQTPLALAVPFTTDWETVSAARAAEIMAAGHPLVTVVPWREMPPRSKALTVDGRSPHNPDYPLQQRLTLTTQNAAAPHAAALAAALQTALPRDPVIHLAAVGDIMLARSLGNQLLAGNVRYPFAPAAAALQTADFTVGNFESALGSGGVPENKRYPFLSPPQSVDALAWAGFDLVSLANNHAMDYGPGTLLAGIGLLQTQGIGVIGAGANETAARAPYLTDINGLTTAFLGYVHVPVEYTGFDTETWTATDAAPGLAWADPATITADVTAVRPQADLVIVLLHSGYEYIEEPSPPQRDAARAAIDAGADLVIGHHAHILQGIEFYNGGVIVYGLGNFAFNIDGPPETAVLHVWLDQDGVRNLSLEPMIVQADGQPRPALPAEAYPILQSVYYLSSLLNGP